MKPKLPKYLEDMGAIALNSPEYLTAKQKAVDHFENCGTCDQGINCPTGKALMDDLEAAMRACIRQSRQ